MIKTPIIDYMKVKEEIVQETSEGDDSDFTWFSK